jgi:hypothetical protein
MNGFIWRLHRHQALFAAGAMAAFATVLLITGLHMANTYHGAVATCSATGYCSPLDQLFNGDGFIIDLVNLSAVVPLLLALFWGVPLVAKEFEDGTQDVAWTQSVTRRSWMGRNVMWSVAAAIVLGATASAFVSWWRGPQNALFGRFSAFDIQGVVPIAYCVFAVALGIAAGTWSKRLLPALAVTLGAFVAVRGAIAIWLRPHFLPPIRVTLPLVGAKVAPPDGAWLLGKSVIDPASHIVNTNALSAIPAACHGALFNGSLVNCLAAHGYRSLLTYQPDGRYWPFQGIEAAIYLVLAVALVSFAYRRVLTADA